MNAVSERNCFRILRSRLEHNAALHPKSVAVFFFISLALLATSDFVHPFNWLAIFENTVVQLSILTIPITLLWLIRPCKCGFRAIDSCRNYLKSGEAKKIRARKFAWLTGFSTSILLWAQLDIVLHIVVSATFSHQIAHLVSGSILLFVSVYVPIVFLKVHKLCVPISIEEQIRVGRLDEQIPGDLQELIAFNLKIGKFDVADVQSRKLLRLAEDLKTEHCA